MNENKKTALVVEGGAMRGIFSSGVLDAFIQNQYYPFDLCIGVSAGSTNLAAYLAHMYQRNYKIYITYSLEKSFINPWKFLVGGHLMDLDWLWHETIKDIRLDLDKIESNPCDYKVGLTDAITGKAVFVRPKKAQLENIIKASSAVPIAYRRPVNVDKHPYFDGGLTAPIPIYEAVREGAEKIIVLRSRKYPYRMSPAKTGLLKFFLKKYPAVIEAIKNRHEVYNDELDYIRDKHDRLEIIEICPPEGFQTSRLTRDKEILKQDYELGFKEGLKLVEMMRSREKALSRN